MTGSPGTGHFLWTTFVVAKRQKKRKQPAVFWFKLYAVFGGHLLLMDPKYLSGDHPFDTSQVGIHQALHRHRIKPGEQMPNGPC